MLNKYNNGKTAWYQSSLLNCPHGFSTRVGGYSTAPLVDGLNLTVTQRKGEIRENVLKNLAIFAEAVGVNPGTVLSVPECNGTNIAYVTSRDAGKGYYNNVGLSYFLNGNVCYDGYIADEEGITIGMKTADCLPILFAIEDGTRIIAVGGAHVGCKDDAHDPICNIATIVPKMILEMKERYQVTENQFRIAFGPSTHQCCCKVSDIMLDLLLMSVTPTMLDGYVSKAESGGWMLDMPGLNMAILRDLGVPKENIDTTDVCTTCSQDPPFFSRIKDGVKTGSMLSVIAMPTLK